MAEAETQKMKDIETYLDAGWDSIGDWLLKPSMR